MSEQKPKRTDDRAPRTGGPKPWQKKPAQANTPSGKTPADKRPPTAGKGKKSSARPSSSSTAPQDNEPYVVIITNVENDFGKLHNAALPYYCGLRAEFEETLDVERLVSAGGPQVRSLVAARHGCGYAVHARTETRSAEVGFYGPADADFSPMKLQKRPHPVRGASTSAAPSEAAAAAVVTAASSSSAQDPTAPAQADPVVQETTEATTNVVEGLALRLRKMHYFEDKLPVHVHLPGHAGGDVLLRVGGEATAAAQEKGDEGASATVGTKRPRDEAGGDDGVDDCESAEDDEGETIEGNNTTSTTTSTDKPSRTKSSRVMVLKQFPNRQRDFVTAVAALSTRVPLRVVRRRLHDLPGYMSCWSLDEKRVRVVFRDSEALFKAKELLDQFGLGTGLRVTLILSDPLSRDNEVFARAREDEEVQ